MIYRRLSLLFFFLFCRAVFSWADTYNEYAGQGLFITSVPTGAKVFIDGVEKGTTPLHIAAVKEGRYQIKIKKDGYEDRLFDLVMRNGSRVELTFDLAESKGRVLLDIKREPSAPALLPFDPRITVDGSPIHENPIALAYGWRTVTIEAFGWEPLRDSILVAEGGDQQFEFILKPAVFTVSGAVLQRKRINPQAAGTTGRTGVGFRVSAPGQGLLEALDENNNVVYRDTLGPFTSWRQQALWNGKRNVDLSGGSIEAEALEDGNYTIRISAWTSGEAEHQTLEFIVQVDSSLEVRPLNAASAVPGLLFAASAVTLPALSFQIQADMLAGITLLQESWKGLPFALAVRFSPLDNLELTAAFSANPRFYADSEWGGGASLKWQFYNLANSSAAVALSYGWASSGPYTVFGMGTGAALRLPVSFRLINSAVSFDLLASPLVLWTSEKGYPDSLLPRLGIEGGALVSYKSIAAGVSLRWDYAPQDASPGPLASALEIKWQPSNFYLSLMGGYWQWNNSHGAFSGLGMGIVY